MLVQQRDNEIGILLNYLNKKKGDQSIPASSIHTQNIEETKSSDENSTLYKQMITAGSSMIRQPEVI